MDSINKSHIGLDLGEARFQKGQQNSKRQLTQLQVNEEGSLQSVDYEGWSAGARISMDPQKKNQDSGTWLLCLSTPKSIPGMTKWWSSHGKIILGEIAMVEPPAVKVSGDGPEIKRYHGLLG